MAQHATGDAELNDFVNAHYQKIVGTVTLITGDRSSAEDAVQNALIKVWRKRPDDLRSLPAWITVVASNEARSMLRRRGSEQRATDRLGSMAEHSTMEPTFDDELQQALSKLPTRERQVVALHYVMDHSVAEIAVLLDIHEGTVKTLLSRGRAHLATMLRLEESS